MSSANVEERLTQLEVEMATLKSSLKYTKPTKNPLATFGVMAGNKFYEEVVRLGAEYRQRDRERTLAELSKDDSK